MRAATRSSRGGLRCARRVLRQVQLAVDLVIEPWVYQRLHLVLDRADVAVRLRFGVDFQPPQVVRQGLLASPDILLEDVTKRMSGVGRDQQAESTLAGGGDGQGCRGRGLSDTALASHEDQVMLE